MKTTLPQIDTYWNLPGDGLLAALNTSPAGLSVQEAAARLERYGPNLLEVKKSDGGLGLFLKQFKSPIVIILLLATVVSSALRDWSDALIILAIVMVSAVLSFVQEYSAGAAVNKLRSQITLKSLVLRGNAQQSILAENIVPGDIVLLSAGSLIPADGVILESRDLFINQAVLTGETFPVEKQPGVVPAQAGLSERTNTVFMGTNVRSGNGKMLVAVSGAQTAFGQIAHRLTLRPPENEFERGIRRLGFLLTEIMLVLVITIFALNVFFKKPVLDSLLFSIALAVGLTPQLLPAIIEINLSKGSRAMAAAGVIVRRLSSIENFGSMDILCTDKTGTLTEGVVHLDGALDTHGESSGGVLRLAALNARLQTGLANPLDEAIIIAAPDQNGSTTKIDEIPYDFVRKRLTVVVCEAQGTCNQRVLLITKGALEGILSVCTKVEWQGKTVPLDPQKLEDIHSRYQAWSGEGYRVLGVALTDMPPKDSYTQKDEAGLTFAGFLLFFDPPKKGVKETISELADYGVQLKIITGDNRLVAEHTMRSIGLEVDNILTGAEINQMSDEALWHTASRTNVFAEVDPNQKEKIILALKKMGHVVGYMGDGVNDAPALHSADVSISVNNAVDVAKEAADFVLMHQDLEVLHKGIIEGRKTFANTLKYIFMATSANFGNMFSVAGISLFLPFLPMLPKQILLINLLTDLPEMTIAQDNVDETFIRKPHRWDIHFIRHFMLVFGSLSSLFDFITFGMLLYLLHASETLFRTGWFVESVLSASLVVFVLRTRLPLIRNRPAGALAGVTVLVVLATLLLPYLPFAPLLGFGPLPPAALGLIVLIVLSYIISAEVAKHFFYKRYN
jgi:Mg2+-importing ATPase